jgi:hypothetical protein
MDVDEGSDEAIVGWGGDEPFCAILRRRFLEA